jgi:hypothetical protein
VELPLLPPELPDGALPLGKSVVLTEMIEPLDAVTVVVTLPSGLVITDVVSAEELEPELPLEPEVPPVAELLAAAPPEAEDVPAVACEAGCGAIRLAAEIPEMFISHLPH